MKNGKVLLKDYEWANSQSNEQILTFIVREKVNDWCLHFQTRDGSRHKHLNLLSGLVILEGDMQELLSIPVGKGLLLRSEEELQETFNQLGWRSSYNCYEANYPEYFTWEV